MSRPRGVGRGLRATRAWGGGLGTSFLLELLVYPALFLLWRRRDLTRA